MQKTVKSLPDSPGIYQFFDANGKLLYIGKAKSLKNRVKSYFRLSPTLLPAPNLSIRITKMISEAKELNYMVVSRESDALVLENSLIKQLKPKYNILLRDDKTYPYIFVDESQDFPRLELTRKIIDKKHTKIKYFGPITSGARELLNIIYANFKLVQKQNCLNGKKACLFYQLDMCLAPCQFKVDKKLYQNILNSAVNCITDPTKIIPLLSEKMVKLADELQFEEAQKIKNQINLLKNLVPSSNVDLAAQESFDLIAISEGENEACMVMFFIRNGKLISSSHSFISYFNNDKTLFEPEEAYSQAILNLYTEQSPNTASELVTPIELIDKRWLEDSIREKTNKIIKLSKATGDKLKLCELAVRNGYELLKTKRKEDKALYFEIKNYFNLSRAPLRVEIFDNSHISQQATVAGMVVWDEGFQKESYRKYKLEAKNEYAQMKEVLTRRVNSFEENPPPDLWLIDGGKANYDLAKEIIESVGTNIDILAIAKEKRNAKTIRAKSKAEDRIICDRGIVKLAPQDPKLLFLQRLRDEAHRFAIDFHRKQKLKEDKNIKMLQIKGIKEGKLKKLLSYFGSFENINNATLEQLKIILSEKDAISLSEFLKNTKNINPSE